VFYGVKGDLLLTLPEPDRDGAEACFQRAFDAAEVLGARMPQLRAAIGLCRLRPEHGRGLLSTVHATFTEGFATRDLIEAAALLEG
jgi:predicted ATPase